MIFSSQRFLQKTNKQILLYDISGWHVFVCFLEEIEDTNKKFRNQLTFNMYSIKEKLSENVQEFYFFQSSEQYNNMTMWTAFTKHEF